MGDQFLEVADEDAGRIVGRIMRLAAGAVRTQVGHDDAKARRGDALGMAEVQPVHLRVGKQPVQQDRRPSVAKLVEGELDTV